MYNVTQAARSANVSGTTIRNWSRLYADFLSPSANPPAGMPREYTPADLSVFSTVAVLRAQLVETEDIRAALEEGQRLEPVSPPPHERVTADQEQANPADQGQQAADRAAAETAIAIYRDRVTTLEARADQLADRLIEAEKRAAAAEKELEVMRQLYEAATSPAPADRRPTFWQWLTGKK